MPLNLKKETKIMLSLFELQPCLFNNHQSHTPPPAIAPDTASHSSHPLVTRQTLSPYTL